MTKPPRRQFNINLSPTGRTLLESLASQDGINLTSELELLIRQAARDRGIKVETQK